MDKTEDRSPVAIPMHNDQALNPHKAGSSKLCHMLTTSDSGEKKRERATELADTHGFKSAGKMWHTETYENKLSAISLMIFHKFAPNYKPMFEPSIPSFSQLHPKGTKDLVS